jgi:hypothetical protein
VAARRDHGAIRNDETDDLIGSDQRPPRGVVGADDEARIGVVIDLDEFVQGSSGGTFEPLVATEAEFADHDVSGGCSGWCAERQGRRQQKLR